MSEELEECPSCQCPYGYERHDNQYVCPECSFEWSAAEEVVAELGSDDLVALS